MTRVKLPSSLRSRAGDRATVDLSAGTVADALGELMREYPGHVTGLQDGAGESSSGVNLYVNGQDVRYMAGMDAAVCDTDEVIFVAIAGDDSWRNDRWLET